jgi:hypothetical protein
LPRQEIDMTTKDDPLAAVAPGRRLAVVLLRGLSRALALMARQLAGARRRAPRADPVLEFYAEAGAPEGALYVDGQLVGHLPGVTRL